MADMRRIGGLRLTVLRGSGEAFLGSAGGVLGQALPSGVNTASPDGRILRLGPDEWLLVGEKDCIAALENALAGLHVAIVDVGEAHAVFELDGGGAGEVLAAGCRLDAADLAPGTCARTVLAGVPVIVEPRTAGVWRMIVPVSYAEHAEAWFRDAMANRAPA